MNDMSYPYARQTIDDDDIDAVIAVLKSDYLTTGPMVDRAEQTLCDYLGCDEAVVCANGTVSLHMIATAYQILHGEFKENDVVIAPALTFNATASAFYLAGARIIFYDCDAHSGLLTAPLLQDKISQCQQHGFNIRALVCVHLNGQACAMPAISALCQQHNIAIFEDACHAFGTFQHSEKIGSCQYSMAASFSFHAVKNITCGEGGVVTTNDAKMARLMRQLRHHGVERDHQMMVGGDAGKRWYHEFHYMAMNYRLNDMSCALIISQLAKLDDWVREKNTLISYYADYLKDHPHIRLLSYNDTNIAWHLCVAHIDYEAMGTTRQALMKKLASHHIYTQVHYIPLTNQPIWQDSLLQNDDFRGAQAYYRSCLSLPLFIGLTKENIKAIVGYLSA